MATIARLITLLEAQMQGFDKATTELEKISKGTENIAQSALKAGKALASAFLVHEISAYVGTVVRFADEMSDMAAQTGIGVERLQQLNFALVGGGVTVDQMASAVAQLSKRLIEGDAGAVRALERLGLSADRLIQLAPDEAFLRIADSIREIPNPMEQSALAMELFGRSGAQLLPAMKDNLRALMEQATKTGAVMNEDLVEKAAQFSDGWDRAKIVAAAMTAQLLELAAASVEAAHSIATMGWLEAIQGATQFSEALAGNGGSAGISLMDALGAVDKRGSPLAVQTLPTFSMSMKEADRITNELNDSIEKKLNKTLKENADAVVKAAEEHRKLQIILGLGHMQAAQEFVEAMQTIRSEMMEFNALIDEVTENFEQSWGEQVTLTVVNSAEMIDQTLLDLRDKGVVYTQDMTLSMGDYFRGLFSDIGAGVQDLLAMLADALGPRFYAIMRSFQDAWSHGRSMVQGVLKGLSGDFSGWVQAIMGGIGLIRSAWSALQSLFGGGEEGTVVNPARDTFLSQWGDPSNKGVGGAGHNLASLLTSLGAGEGGGAIFSALQKADTMALFRPAAQAIVSFLTEMGHPAVMNFHRGGMVPGTGEVPATLLGGERVQSRQEVGEMRGLLAAVTGLRDDMRRRDRRLPLDLISALQTRGV